MWLCAAIGAAATCLCFTMFIACFFKQLKLAIDVVDASADFIMVTKRILLVPLVYFFLSLTVVIIWFSGYLGVMSMNEMEPMLLIPQAKSIKWTGDTVGYACVMWFGLIWMLCILDYAKNFIILVSASTYYYNSP